MQVCNSLQTDNHASTPPLSFLQAGCPSCRPTNSVKALMAKNQKKICKLWEMQVNVLCQCCTNDKGNMLKLPVYVMIQSSVEKLISDVHCIWLKRPTCSSCNSFVRFWPILILVSRNAASLIFNTVLCRLLIAFSALTLLVGWQEGHPACKKLGCWRGYLSGAGCRLAYGPADATATHCLLLQYNPDWFYLSGTGWPGYSRKKGR